MHIDPHEGGASTAEGSSPPVRVMRIIARLNVGGPAIHVALLSSLLDRGPFRTMLVAGEVGPDEGDMSYAARGMGVEPVYIPGLQREIAPLADLRVLGALLRLMKRYRPHIVHTHTAKAGLLGRLAAFLSGTPVIVHTFHGHVFHSYFSRTKTALFITLERVAARMSDAILTLSEGLRSEISSYLRIAPERIRVVPLGFDLNPLRHPDSLRGAFRAEFDVSTGAPLVGIIGRLVPVKNHELFLQAAAQVLDQLPEARFVIVGDGERRAALEHLVMTLGISHAVIFTGWRRDLPAIYADLDVVSITSDNEGTPVSLIEAMASGVPVVSTRVGGVPDLLEHGKFGLLVPAGDAQALAQALLSALRERDEARVAAARYMALDRYDGMRLTTDIATLYIDLLQAKGAWPPGH